MYAILHKTRLKMAGAKWVPDGCRVGAKRVPSGYQNALLSGPQSRLSRRLIHGVLAFISCCDARCRYVHIPSRVRNATVLGFRADYGMSGSHEPMGGN